MATRADPEIVERLAEALRAGPRPVADVERALVEHASRGGLLKAALALRVIVRSGVRGTTWELPA